ncbi:DUF6463 family protein [Nocardia sp. NPDC059091]|uniref:DUF6463 family protein n=1 Tax=unclassified Nocardia TaxID=2637762 RepID=UPI0036BD81AC
MIAWAGRLIVLFGAAHTILALTWMRAARYAGDWFSGALWHDDLAVMSPANSALWLSLDSFGIPLVLVGLTALWLDRRGITPPLFIVWVLGLWTVFGAVVLGRFRRYRFASTVDTFTDDQRRPGRQRCVTPRNIAVGETFSQVAVARAMPIPA